jgi:hypothetical protein
VAPLFAAPASGESRSPAHPSSRGKAGSRAHQRVVARAAPCGASDANPSRLSAGGALTRIDPPSDVLCRLPGTALNNGSKTVGQLALRGTSRIRLKLRAGAYGSLYLRWPGPPSTPAVKRMKCSSPGRLSSCLEKPACDGFTLHLRSPIRAFTVKDRALPDVHRFALSPSSAASAARTTSFRLGRHHLLLRDERTVSMFPTDNCFLTLRRRALAPRPLPYAFHRTEPLTFSRRQ